jgi:CheY-like chemotaxis protein/nitrogen-specific signal transduction histidine kinase
LSLSELCDRNGAFLGVSVVAHDVTAQVVAEQALRDADRRKDNFLAMLAHELRNPLSPIRNAVEVLGTRPASDAVTSGMLEVLRRQTTNLSALVDDLLDVSRITRGLVELRPEQVSLHTIVERALDSVRPLLEDKRHHVSTALPPSPVHVIGDPVRLEQILVNLLTNAAKYTDPAGRIAVTVASDGDRVTVSVRDNGIGIAADMLDEVFTLFGQAERGLDRSQGGLGIGLTVTRNLVELHGGSLRASSAGPGRGAEFTVTLPLAPAVAATPAPPRRAERDAAEPKRLLVVDDNADSADTLSLLLRAQGHRVVVAYDGAQALALAGETTPDCVLLDLGLPGIDGYEVASRLRSDPRTRAATLIALTGYGQANDRIRVRAAGFDGHLIKPVDMDALTALLSGKQRNQPAGTPLR